MVQREYMHSGDPVHLYNEPPYRHSQPGSGYNGAVIENSGTVRVSVTADNSCRTDRQQEKQTCGGGSHRVLLKLRNIHRYIHRYININININIKTQFLFHSQSVFLKFSLKHSVVETFEKHNELILMYS